MAVKVKKRNNCSHFILNNLPCFCLHFIHIVCSQHTALHDMQRLICLERDVKIITYEIQVRSLCQFHKNQITIKNIWIKKFTDKYDLCGPSLKKYDCFNFTETQHILIFFFLRNTEIVSTGEAYLKKKRHQLDKSCKIKSGHIIQTEKWTEHWHIIMLKFYPFVEVPMITYFIYLQYFNIFHDIFIP